MWWALIDSLRTWLEANLAGTAIAVGSAGAVPEARTVLLVRGPGAQEALYQTERGKETVHVECWEYADPEADGSDYLAVGYQRLEQLEQDTRQALNDWWTQTVAVSGTAFRVELVGGVVPDGDLFRPSVGSRITLEIEWRKTT